MLHPKLLNRLLAACAVAAITTTASAQGYPAGMQGIQLTPQEKANIAKLTEEMQADAARGAQDPQVQAETAKVAREVDAIANPHLATARANVLRFLGINPNGSDAVYIFVSWSMPLNMLRAYEVDAMWTGATVVFRGVPPGVSLLDFITKDLRKLVWRKGAAADISLDPRLFDAYQVNLVPTIVLTKTRKNFMCAGAGTETVTVKGHQASYSLCPPISEKDYIKVSGAVTVDYALHQFEDNGWTSAKPFLDAMRKGYPQGSASTRAQQPFTGTWQNAYTPEKLMLNGPASRPGSQGATSPQ